MGMPAAVSVSLVSTTAKKDVNFLLKNYCISLDITLKRGTIRFTTHVVSQKSRCVFFVITVVGRAR